jgi:hypothetical protein
MSDSDHGEPFDETGLEAIDSWSRAVFEACRDWPLAASGRWFRVEGWIRLRIAEPFGERLEPLFAIEIETMDGHVNLDFGSWCTPISPPFNRYGPSPEGCVQRTRELVEGWLGGEVKLASYSDGTGWRGSKIVHGGELPAALEPVPVEIGEHARVIVKTPRRSEWRSWRRIGDGLWIESDVGEE